MKVPYVIAVAALLTTALLVSSVAAGQAETGNGAPSGAHYNLNIVGVKNTKYGMPTDFTGSNGHVIFVGMSRTGKVTTSIYLSQGDFDVIDRNGLDGDAAFQLPAPEGETCYSIWARALGQPGGKANITTCANYTDGGVETTYCSLYNIVELNRTRGKQKFDDVTYQLTHLCSPILPTGPGCVPIFSEPYEDWMWQYDNNGLRLAQLRFYLVDCP